MNITEINKEYYDKAYLSKAALPALIHSIISYDQQSKSKRNFTAISPLIQQIKKQKKDIKYLDYGFGHGSLILKFNKDVELYGCDISKEAVAKFNKIIKFLGKKNIRVFSLEQLNSILENTRFDIISCSHVIEHVEDDNVLVSQMKEMLVNNGYLVVNLPINEIWDDPKHARKYTKNTACLLLENNGFVVENTIEFDRFTGLLLKYEQVHALKNIFRPLLRAVRLLYAIMPLSLLKFSEYFISSTHKNQQLILIARKK